MTPALAVVPRWHGIIARDSLMMLMRIERWDLRRDGPLSDTALQQKVQSLGYEGTVRVYPAGTVIASPSVERARIQGVARGLVKVTIDGESAILSAGDLVFVSPGAVRRLEVIGSAPAHCLDASLS